jgi:hypothetical protein
MGVATAKETAKQQLPQSVEHSAEKLLLAIHAPAAILFEQSGADWPATVAGVGPLRSELVPVPPPRA